MSFNSIGFLIFLAAAIVFYGIFPAKRKAGSILVISYAFYALYNWKLLPFLIGYTVAVYIAGLCIRKHKEYGIITVGVGIALLPLVISKYATFGLVLPLGISYFTFKSIGYLVDVYKGKAEAEKNIVVLAAFVSFFPEMLIGPIDRASNLMTQLKSNETKMTWESVQYGTLILLGGYFEKMVVADRLGVIVNTVYGNLYTYEGVTVAVAAVSYSLQIYFDFAGCTYMALGVGRIFGFTLPENFRQPYLAVSVEDFWRRWHLSLTSWLRDYIYIPLGGNRKGTLRKYVNIMIVFLTSGIWHGAGLNYIVWGGLNGGFQIVGRALKQWKSAWYYRLHIVEESRLCIWWKRLGTFFWMTIAWVFFRAGSISEAALVFRKMLSAWNPWVLFDGTLYTLGLSERNVFLLILVLLIMAEVEVLHEQKRQISVWVMKQNFIVKCILTYGVIFGILVLGIYGTAYDAGNFIYMQF